MILKDNWRQHVILHPFLNYSISVRQTLHNARAHTRSSRGSFMAGHRSLLVKRVSIRALLRQSSNIAISKSSLSLSLSRSLEILSPRHAAVTHLRQFQPRRIPLRIIRKRTYSKMKHKIKSRTLSRILKTKN